MCQTTSFNKHSHQASWYVSITLDSTNKERAGKKKLYGYEDHISACVLICDAQSYGYIV